MKRVHASAKGGSHLKNVDTQHFFKNLVHQGANFVEAVKGGPCQC